MFNFYVCKVIFWGLVLVCGIQKDRIPLRKACGFNVHFVGMSYVNFKIILSLGSISEQDKKSAAVFIFPGMCAIVKSNCNTQSQAFHKCGGIIFLRKTIGNDFH